MIPETGPGTPVTTHIWVPFRGTSLYVDFAGGRYRTPDSRDPLTDAVPQGGVTRDDRYGEPMWRVAAEYLHAVVEALWSEDRPLRIHLDQAPSADQPPRHDRDAATCDG
ncbi:hypothetical protein ACFU53_24360 [Streptomyces sp. NPDC057474]|uniref:hypothetical protein n=1 Tax=Streptomyces sp. NPDC057474 TaxID=3346144 RepID=UPI0036C0ED8C